MARPEWMKGKVLKDATRPVTINIRQRDIDGADSLNGERCVAGRCTLRALDAQAVWFYRSKAYVQWDDEPVILRYSLSASLINRVIVVLDDPNMPNSMIRPGLYELRPPTPAQRLGVNRAARNPGVRAPRVDRGHRVMGRVTAAFHA